MNDCRPLTSWESSIIRRLLTAEFPGREEVLRQFDDVCAIPLDDNNSLRLVTRVVLPAQVQYSVPVEADAPDSDGIQIHILLHVREGKISELEIFKDNSSKVLKKPTADELNIIAYPIVG